MPRRVSWNRTSGHRIFRNKTKSVMGASKAIIDKFGGCPAHDGRDPHAPGVARKTGNVVLGTAYGIASGVVVDTMCCSLSRRLDLSRMKTREGEQD